MDILPIILPALVGGAVAIVASHFTFRSTLKANEQKVKLDAKKELAQLRLSKGESLYFEISKFIAEFLGKTLYLDLVMRDKIDYNTYLDEIIESSKNQKSDGHKVEMLTFVYFPELSQEYIKIKEQLSKIYEIKRLHKMCYNEGGEHSKFLQEFTLHNTTLEELNEDFKKILAQNLSALSHEI